MKVIHEPQVSYLGYDQMLADPQVEAVIVAVADQFHVDAALKAIAAGKHVLVEKPLGVSVEECEALQVRLLVQVRKCFCDVPDCVRKIFVECLTPFVDAFARVTRRLYKIVQVIGLATGGRLGVRVTDHLGIETTRQTILRRIMALPTVPVGTVTQIGIDDFSFRRGRNFGTIVVDLQTPIKRMRTLIN